MPKTLGIISRTNANTHWFRCNPFGPNDIQSIPDPEGETDRKQITSIPSPFARIDLFKTAFRNVVEHARREEDRSNLEGDTISHKFVSHSLDMAQMFFNLNLYKQDESKNLRILTWERDNHLKSLLDSNNHNHKILGETLELFLEQDKETYNFDRWKNIYLLTYDYKVVGGTSPSTMFFTTANDLNFVNIKVGNHTFFRNIYTPLFKRTVEFQKYIHLLFRANPQELHSSMKEMKDYLDLNLKHLANYDANMHSEVRIALNNYNEMQFKSNYPELDTGVSGQIIQVLGIPLRMKKVDKTSVERASDFVIKSPKFAGANPGELKPLVLQNNFNKIGFNYLKGGTWEQNTPVPYRDDKELSKRKLPSQNEMYPYLTVDDFLEPYLIKLIYPLNSKYFNGNVKGFEKNDPGFLLPVKKFYTRFFDLSTLDSTLPTGQKVFELQKRAGGGVAATLRIPVDKQGEYITFERLYYPPATTHEIRKPDITATTNDGAIIESQFGLAVAPFIKLPSQFNNHYRVVTVDRDILPITENLDYNLNFYSNNNGDIPLEGVIVKKRSDKKAREEATSKFYVINDSFDYIEASNGIATGLLLPGFEPYVGGSNNFTFAVDFGTTNSHMEYLKGKMDRSTPLAFEITKEDFQFATTYEPDFYFEIASEIPEIILQEFLPELIGATSEFKFPTRTTIAEHVKINHFQAVYALADLNLPFYYEKRKERPNIRVNTDLKWSNFTQEQDDQNRVQMFLENLMFIIRNKILLNQGDLERTKLVWFYPSSMTPMRKDKLKRLWQNTFEKYITKQKEESTGPGQAEGNIRELSESLAPYYFYRTALNVSSSAAPVLSIDIGGGTTDVVAFYENKPVFLTSFRFAGDAIFGDGFTGSPNTNGFVRRFSPKVRTILDHNNLNTLMSIMDTLVHRSSDIISFFFSLEGNKEVKDKGLNLSFPSLLSDDEDLKIVFLVFYGAIIYHVGKLMKKAGMAMPRYVCFGGNGSKVINVIDGSGSKLTRLTGFTQLMLEKVFGESYGQGNTENLNLVQVAEPKELTCKGGLSEGMDADVEDIKLVLLGDDQDTMAYSGSSKFPALNMKYNELNEQHYQNVTSEVRIFISLLFSLHNEYNFNKNFGINNVKMNYYRDTLSKDLLQYMKDGLEMKGKSDLSGDPNALIEEPLFFYPLVGALNNLATRIAGE